MDFLRRGCKSKVVVGSRSSLRQLARIRFASPGRSPSYAVMERAPPDTFKSVRATGRDGTSAIAASRSPRGAMTLQISMRSGLIGSVSRISTLQSGLVSETLAID